MEVRYEIVREERQVLGSVFPHEQVAERYQIIVDGEAIGAAEVTTTLEETQVVDIEVIASWSFQSQEIVDTILKNFDVLGFANAFGAGFGLTARLSVLPGLLTIHLGQSVIAPCVSLPALAEGIGAEAACEVEIPFLKAA